MIRKKVKHIYFKSFIDNADIINTHNYFTSYSEFFNKKMTSDISHALPAIKEKIKNLGLTNRSFYVYILPFDDAEEDKKSIMQKIMREGEDHA